MKEIFYYITQQRHNNSNNNCLCIVVQLLRVFNNIAFPHDLTRIHCWPTAVQYCTRCVSETHDFFLFQDCLLLVGNLCLIFPKILILVADRCGRSSTGITGSNLAREMNACQHFYLFPFGNNYHCFIPKPIWSSRRRSVSNIQTTFGPWVYLVSEVRSYNVGGSSIAVLLCLWKFLTLSVTFSLH
jgi:hypothetical protein